MAAPSSVFKQNYNSRFVLRCSEKCFDVNLIDLYRGLSQKYADVLEEFPYILSFNKYQRQNSGEWRLGDLDSQRFFKIMWSQKNWLWEPLMKHHLYASSIIILEIVLYQLNVIKLFQKFFEDLSINFTINILIKENRSNNCHAATLILSECSRCSFITCGFSAI